MLSEAFVLAFQGCYVVVRGITVDGRCLVFRDFLYESIKLPLAQQRQPSWLNEVLEVYLSTKSAPCFLSLYAL